MHFARPVNPGEPCGIDVKELRPPRGALRATLGPDTSSRSAQAREENSKQDQTKNTQFNSGSTGRSFCDDQLPLLKPHGRDKCVTKCFELGRRARPGMISHDEFI